MRTLITAVSMLVVFSAFAGGKYQINLILAPSYERLSFRNKHVKAPFFYKFSYNFGGEFRYFIAPDFSLAVGLQFNDRGFRSHPVYRTTDGFIIDDENAVVNISAKYITVPIEMVFSFEPVFRTEIFINAGIAYGYLVGQTFKGKRLPDEFGVPESSIYNGLSEGRSNIKWFDKSYTSVNIGVGAGWHIRSRLVLTVNPVYYRQIDRLELPFPDGPLITFDPTFGYIKPRLDSFTINLKLGWYFSDQIENTKKKL